MKNLRKGKSAGKESRARRTVKQNRGIDLFGNICKCVDKLATLAESSFEVAQQALARFVSDLSEEDRRTVRHAYRKQPSDRQEAIFRALVDLGGSFGPAGALLHEIMEDDRAWIDALPSPVDDRPEPLPEAFWRTFYIERGFTEEEAAVKAAEAATEDRRSPEDRLRQFYAQQGWSPEMVERGAVKHRRDAKLRSAKSATLAAEIADAINAREQGLRRTFPEIARYADTVARELVTLVVQPEGAAALRSGAASELLAGIGRAIFAGQPNTPRVGTDGRLVARRPADAPIWRWNDIAKVAGKLAESITTGTAPEADQIAQVARAVASIAREARAFAAELKQARRRPPKNALDAAEKLKGQGLSWHQIALVLASQGLHLEPHTSENIRKSVSARRRRRGGIPPATKS